MTGFSSEMEKIHDEPGASFSTSVRDGKSKSHTYSAACLKLIQLLLCSIFVPVFSLVLTFCLLWFQLSILYDFMLPSFLHASCTSF